MNHAAILALGGIGGDVLRVLYDEEVLTAMLAFIHPCEKTILKQLINIADSYKTLKCFTRRIPHFGKEQITLDDGSKIMPGMYLRAFSSGLHDSLEPYRTNLVNLEKKVLEFPETTLSGILSEVLPFVPLLTTLNSIVNQIVTNKLHGCKILQMLHQNLLSGIDMVDTAMARIIQCCHQVMLKQLTSWLLHGHLLDPYSEFFIESCMTSSEGLHSSMTTLDSESVPDNILNEPLTEYRIVLDQVPSYIPPSVPEKAKFVGSMVILFSRDPRDKNSDECMKMHNFVTKKMESSLLEQLKSLQNSRVLNISYLESAIDNVRLCVTQHLFSLAKDGADLMGELRLIRELYLLGRGELFVTFLRNASNTLFKPVSSNSGRDLSNLLNTSARSVQLNSDVIMEKFSFKVPPKDAVAPGCSVWSVMTLEYNPPWPLHLLFTPTVLLSYNNLFNFLLQVKMAELNLHNVCLEIIKRKDQPVRQEVWSLHNCLMFLIHNLQCYLQLDVMEGEFSILQAALDKTEDFEQVIHQHSLFITHITAQAFLLYKEVHNPDQPSQVKRHPVNRCLTEILKLCDNFCAEVANGVEISEDSLNKFTEDLDSNISMLMTLITLLGDKDSGLRLLLLRLDYNRHFSGRTN
uniref:Gamma-tubulin complex component n=1 Tax=Cuerna arida TaxID=1464854 RepID=A0A1B6GNT4_9HEMI